MNKGFKIAISIIGVFVLFITIIFVVVGILTNEPEREPIIETKEPTEPEGIDISKQSVEDRINHALETANSFLKAIHRDDFEESYKYLRPIVSKVIYLSDYRRSIEQCGKDTFPLEVKREHLLRQNFDDWRGVRYDSVVFEIPKERVPEKYCSIYGGGRSGVTIWLEDRNHKYYIGYEVHVMCDRIGNNLRSEWGIDSMGAWIDVNFQDRAVLRGARIVIRTKGK